MTRTVTVDGATGRVTGRATDGTARRPGVLRRLAVGVMAAVAAGVLLGSVARLMMRLTTLAAGGETQFSLAGTAAILLVFVLFTLPGSVLASLLERRGRSVLLFVGALALCLPTTGVAAEDLRSLGPLSASERAGVLLAAGGVFAAVLALPFLALRLIARGLHEPR
jgi:hypothetical protein